MIVDLEKLPPDQSTLVGDEAIPYKDARGAESLIDCHVELDIRRVGDAYYIHARLKGEFTTDCDRCLEPVRYRVEPTFDLVIQRSREPSVLSAESTDEDYVVLPYNTTRYNLDRHTYENLVVNIPMQIVCRPDCRGLCPGCGENLNKSSCRCDDSTDARWSELKRLRDQLP